MADLGLGTALYDASVLQGGIYTFVPDVYFDLGGGSYLAYGPYSARAAATRSPGDYGVRLYSGAVPIQREVLYSCPTDARCYIRHIGFINTTNAALDITVWLDSVMVMPLTTIPVLDGIGMDVSLWLLESNDRLEASASAAGLNLIAYGVEEVR